MPDAIFAHDRLAAVYDPFDPDRSDLAAYLAMVDEFAPQDARVLDIGCGTGTFATLLAARGVQVTGVDPAAASLRVARGKPHADQVTWLDGTASDVAAHPAHHHAFDLAFMTGNVAQVFTDDADWAATLRAAHTCLKPGGRLVLETRIPERRAYRDWTKADTRQVIDVPGIGTVEAWCDLVELDGHPAADWQATHPNGVPRLVTFAGPTIFHSDGERIESSSTLRFRTWDEVHESLRTTGFEVDEVRDAPDRPAREWVFVARAT